MDDHTLDPEAGDLRRIEVITGTGRRRHWTAESKARIVAITVKIDKGGINSYASLLIIGLGESTSARPEVIPKDSFHRGTI